MDQTIVRPPRPTRRGRVIALHCSGAGAAQWSHLGEALGASWELLAPEQYGCDSRGHWPGDGPFTLAHEAAHALALIDEREDLVHLVGHSYGGGVALHIALSRPDRIASMALYEPSAFHLLSEMGAAGAEAFAEIAGVARRVSRGVAEGDHRGAVAHFVDYWNGPGAWERMRPAVQNGLVRWVPKAPLDFRALFEEPTPAAAYRALDFPVLILRGERGPMPTRIIAEGLADLLPRGRLAVVRGAGHMGPITHALEVSALMVQHIVSARGPGRRLPRRLADALARVAPAAEAAP